MVPERSVVLRITMALPLEKGLGLLVRPAVGVGRPGEAGQQQDRAFCFRAANLASQGELCRHVVTDCCCFHRFTEV